MKCPFSIRHTTPTDPNIKLEFLKNDNGTLSLSRTINTLHSVRYKWHAQVFLLVTSLSGQSMVIFLKNYSLIESTGLS